MAAGKHPLVEQSTTVPLISDVVDAASKPRVLTALFLRPRAGDDGAAPPSPSGSPGPVPAIPRGMKADFKGWAGVPQRWPEWVEKLRRRHEPLWRKVGILHGILASTRRVRRRDHEHVLLQLAAFWNEATSTFVFPWGEATLTLDDIAVLAGLPLFGVPVRAPVSHSLEKDVAAIEVVRAVLNRSKKKKPSYGAWLERFVDRKLEEEEAPPSAAGGGGDGKARELDVEHGAFLAMWLSLFVFPGPPFDIVRREALPLAVRLARGQSVALAPAALATIYDDLSALKRRIASGKEDKPFIVSAPAHILQLWVWEHFTQLSPEPVASSSAQGDADMPRAARWHEVGKTLSSKEIHEVFMSPKEFKWRPYGNRTLFGQQPVKDGFWSTATREEHLSLVQCLHSCELVGMNCIQQYNPHRVARQLGFDQDIPATIPRASAGWEKAWETYNIEAEEFSEFIFPRHKPSVTVQYAKWWKPYSSACGGAISNAARLKEGHGFGSPAKRKTEGVLAGNSGKKLRLPVATATRGRPPNIPEGTNIYPSQPSGNHATIRSRAISATGMPQPPPHAAYDSLDHICLSKRLNSITKMRKQHNTECLVKGGEQERIVERVKIVIPKPPSVDPKKAVLHKVIDQALPDAVASSAIIVDESSGGSVMERPQAKCLEQSKGEDLNTANGENSSRTEPCHAMLLNVGQGAVSTVRNEAIGAGTEVDMISTHEDLLVISDDDECDKSSSKGHEVSAMHVKSHMLGANMSLIGEQNEDNKLVDARNDEQDSQVMKKVSKQGNFGDIIEISDDELDEETSKKAGVFVIKEDAPSTMRKSPEMEPTSTILQECSEEKQVVRETNEGQDNGVMKEGTMQKSSDYQLVSVQDDTTLRQLPDVLTNAATAQPNDGLLQGPTEEMDKCIVTGDIGNIDKVTSENGGSLSVSKKGNKDISVSNQELEHTMEHSAGASRKKSGNSERFSSRLLDGNTKLVSHEVCTKTLYYLSRFDRTKDAWDKDGNSLPRRAVGTMEMIQKASAIRQAEMAELKKKINTLMEEIRALEAVEKGKSPE